MRKNKLILFLLVLIAISSMLYTHPGLKVIAEAKDCNEEEQVQQTPTATGEADFSNMSSGLTIYASSEEIAPGGSITLYVESGGLGYPPYTWSVDDASYSITSETNADFEEATLTANAGSCGGEYSDSNINVTVTVTDSYGKTATIVIRNTNGEEHGGYYEGYYQLGNCYDYVTVGANQYRICLYTEYYMGPNPTYDGACTDPPFASGNQCIGDNDAGIWINDNQELFSEVLSLSGIDIVCCHRVGGGCFWVAPGICEGSSGAYYYVSAIMEQRWECP